MASERAWRRAWASDDPAARKAMPTTAPRAAPRQLPGQRVRAAPADDVHAAAPLPVVRREARAAAGELHLRSGRETPPPPPIAAYAPVRGAPGEVRTARVKGGL